MSGAEEIRKGKVRNKGSAGKRKQENKTGNKEMERK